MFKKLCIACLLLALTPVLSPAETPDIISMVMEKQEDQAIALLKAQPELLETRNESFNSSLMHIAAQAGANRVLQYLLTTDLDVDDINWDWHTALHWAAYVENLEGMDLLLAQGAGVDAATYKGETPLYIAVQYGRNEAVRKLVDAGADVQAQAKNDVSLLHAAAVAGNTEAVTFLKEQGVDIDSRNLYRKTPLHYAALMGETEAVAALITAGADIEAVDSIGRNALDFALGKDRQESAEVLRKAGLKAGYDGFPELRGPYLGQTPPGRKPELFAPGIISTEGWEFGPTFTPDGKQMLFTRREGEDQLRRNTIMITRMENGRWTKSAVAPFSGDHFDYEPFVIDGGRKVLFGSRRPLPESTDVEVAGNNDAVQWVLDRVDGAWTNLRPYGPPLQGRAVMYVTEADNGNLYFTSKTEDGRYDLFWSEKKGNVYAEPRLLGGGLSEPIPRMHPFIAPDESYVLFDAQPNAPENYDNFTCISFRDSDGVWSAPKMLNLEHPAITTHGIAMVSPDGEYMFFSSGGNLFWVDAGILEEYR